MRRIRKGIQGEWDGNAGAGNQCRSAKNVGSGWNHVECGIKVET